MNKTLLLVEDDTDLLSNNKEFLQKRGYQTLTAETLEDAGAAFAHEQIDLVLLDVNMPDGSGFDFVSAIRNTSDVPVILLTSRADKTDMLDGLNRGSCDYITKPFDYDILLARIEAQLRHIRQPDKIAIGELSLNMVSNRAFFCGKDIGLTQRQFLILLALTRKQGESISKEILYQEAWGQPMTGDGNALFAQMSLLKKKLEEHSEGRVTIFSSRGEGYSIEIMRSAERKGLGFRD